MHFATAKYFEQLGLAVFYPYVDVVFELDDSGAHYHIPLLLAPFGYSTYRGS
jgi:5-hydroxyisourate hydrolase